MVSFGNMTGQDYFESVEDSRFRFWEYPSDLCDRRQMCLFACVNKKIAI